MMKKILSCLMAVLLLMLAACGPAAPEPDTDSVAWRLAGLDPAAEMMTVNGESVSVELYLYWLQYAASIAASFEGCTDEAGNLLWEHELEPGYTVRDYVLEETAGQAKTFLLVEEWAETYGVAFTEEDEAAVDEEIAYYVESVGGQEAYEAYLKRIGLSAAANRRLTRDYYLYNELLELTKSEGSGLYIDDETLYSYEGVTEDAVLVDHVLFFVTGVEADDAMRLDTMQQVRDLLLELEGRERTDRFNYIADTYSEDTGRPYNLNGYLVTEETNFVQSFKDAALALEEGELSEIVTSEYGYHLLLRKNIRDYVAAEYLNARMQEAMDAAEVVTSEACDGLDMAGYLTAYAAETAAAEPGSTDDTQGAE